MNKGWIHLRRSKKTSGTDKPLLIGIYDIDMHFLQINGNVRARHIFKAKVINLKGVTLGNTDFLAKKLWECWCLLLLMVFFTKGVVDCVDLMRNLCWCSDDVLIMMLQSYHPLRYQMSFGEAWHDLTKAARGFECHLSFCRWHFVMCCVQLLAGEWCHEGFFEPLSCSQLSFLVPMRFLSGFALVWIRCESWSWNPSNC